jgi:polyether ionophore transport system ATP-binding protein
MSAAIGIAGLRKSYGKTTALDGLDMTVVQGEVHGFLGPNGAGKTTTIRILLGLLRADGGTVKLLGGDPWQDATTLHRRLAYVPGDVSLWPSFTGGEVIDLLGRLRGPLDAGRRASLIERFELDPTIKSRAYSKGNRQKVALIAALASDTELLLLDEPTAGLDPLMEAAFRECVEAERQRGRTVLLSSHILSEVEALCDRVTIIRRGRAVESGSLAELRHLTRTSISAELDGQPTGLDQMPGVHGLDIEGHRVRCQVDADQLNALLAKLSAVGVRTLTSQPPTLEELFLRHYVGDGAASAGEGPASAGEGPAGHGPAAEGPASAAEGQAAEGQAAEGQAAEGQAAESQAAESQAGDGTAGERPTGRPDGIPA